MPAFIEITDTVETAYDMYKDSVGIDSVRITRIYYYIYTQEKTSYTLVRNKVYLDFELKEYFGMRKGTDIDRRLKHIKYEITHCNILSVADSI